MGLFDILFDRFKFNKNDKNKPAPKVACQKPWFNMNSPHDQKIITSPEPITEFYDIDLLNTFESLQNDKHCPNNNFVFFQQWGPVEQGQGRSYYWLDIQTAEKLGKAINLGYTKNLVLICTTFQIGAIRKLADTIKPDILMELLGFFWYFSGDSIVDETEYAKEIAYLASKVSVKRISILTGEYDNQLDEIFIEDFKQAKSLENFAVFQVDDGGLWPEIPTPKIDEFLKK